MTGADDKLPPYLWEPVPAPGQINRRGQGGPRLVDLARQEWARAGAAGRSRPAPWAQSTTPSGRHSGQSPHFARTVPLSRPRLAAGIESWWTGGVPITVQRRLQLGRPTGNADSGWTMRGRVRRLTRWHWVPVVVEVWPLYDNYARMTMTPQGHVFASKRYFRLGNSALDRLCAALSRVSSGSDP